MPTEEEQQKARELIEELEKKNNKDMEEKGIENPYAD